MCNATNKSRCLANGHRRAMGPPYKSINEGPIHSRELILYTCILLFCTFSTSHLVEFNFLMFLSINLPACPVHSTKSGWYSLELGSLLFNALFGWSGLSAKMLVHKKRGEDRKWCTHSHTHTHSHPSERTRDENERIWCQPLIKINLCLSCGYVINVDYTLLGVMNICIQQVHTIGEYAMQWSKCCASNELLINILEFLYWFFFWGAFTYVLSSLQWEILRL